MNTGSWYLKVGALFLLSFLIAFSFSPELFAVTKQQTQQSVETEATNFGAMFSYQDGIITNFDSAISLDKNGKATIEENITVYFPLQKHGIYRFIPNEVTLETKKSLKQPIKVLSVTYQKIPKALGDVAGETFDNYTFSTSSGNYTVLKIGQANEVISGAYLYTIRYTMDSAIRFQEGFQELYLNVTGDKWEIPILKASAIVTASTNGSETKCYTGKSGSTESNCSVLTNTIKGHYSFATTNLSRTAAEGLTIAIKYPDGAFTQPPPPSVLSQLIALLWIGSPLLLPVIAFLYGYSMWKKHGKDINMSAIPPLFIPTDVMERENISIQNSLLAMRALPTASLAELIRIAERNLLTIEYFDKKVSLKLTPTQQRELPKYLETQPTSVKTLLETLTNNYSEETSVSSLKNVYEEIAQSNREAAAEFKEAPYITDKSENIQKLFIGLVVLSVAVTVGSFYGLGFLSIIGLFLLPFASISCVLIFGIFAFGMLKRTNEGDSLYRDLLGMKKYIKAAELKRLEFFNDPKKMIAHFEQILPYAVILKLDKQWTKEFGPILERLEYQPTWIHSNLPLYQALPHTYAAMATQMNSSMAKISTPPQSGSSSFGGGGGFSGGGSGGGGGGSW